MQSADPQQLLFNHIKGMLPSHLNLVDAVAEKLNISNDSAYRRIRGEKPLSLEELQVLAQHFKISVDQLLHLKSDAFIFTGRITNSSDYKYENWLESVVTHLQFFLSAKPSHMFYRAKEVPFYYYFLQPELAAFKSFFFLKSILYYEDWKNAKFSADDDYSKYQPWMEQTSQLYATLPCTEVWSIESISSTLHQLEFYHTTGALRSEEDAMIVLDKLLLALAHVELQAEYGVKLHHGQDPASSTVPFKMFVNDIVLGDNMHLIQLGNKYMTAINYSVINFITTMDESFNDHTRKTLENLAQKSTLISGVNEKERIVFFNKLRARVEVARQVIRGSR
jgi:hypothetical protein